MAFKQLGTTAGPKYLIGLEIPVSENQLIIVI